MRNDDIYNKNKLQKTRLTGFNKFTFQTNLFTATKYHLKIISLNGIKFTSAFNPRVLKCTVGEVT